MLPILSWDILLCLERNDDSEPANLLGEICEKNIIMSLYKGDMQALKYILVFELNKP